MLIINFCLFFWFFYSIRSTLNRIYCFHWFLFFFFVYNFIFFHDNAAYNLLIWDLESWVLWNLNFDIVENMILRRNSWYLFLWNIQNLFIQNPAFFINLIWIIRIPIKLIIIWNNLSLFYTKWKFCLSFKFDITTLLKIIFYYILFIFFLILKISLLGLFFF